MKKLNKKRWTAIQRKYGLSEDQWWNIYHEQEGCCFVCGRKLKVGGKNARNTANTDHCHTTGKIRGLLCRNCNMILIPLFERKPELAENIFVYLTREPGYGQVPEE